MSSMTPMTNFPPAPLCGRFSLLLACTTGVAIWFMHVRHQSSLIHHGGCRARPDAASLTLACIFQSIRKPSHDNDATRLPQGVGGIRDDPGALPACIGSRPSA